MEKNKLTENMTSDEEEKMYDVIIDFKINVFDLNEELNINDDGVKQLLFLKQPITEQLCNFLQNDWSKPISSMEIYGRPGMSNFNSVKNFFEKKISDPPNKNNHKYF